MYTKVAHRVDGLHISVPRDMTRVFSAAVSCTNQYCRECHASMSHARHVASSSFEWDLSVATLKWGYKLPSHVQPSHVASRRSAFMAETMVSVWLKVKTFFIKPFLIRPLASNRYIRGYCVVNLLRGTGTTFVLFRSAPTTHWLGVGTGSSSD